MGGLEPPRITPRYATGCDVMQILVVKLRGAVHQQQRAAAYAALLPSLGCMCVLVWRSQQKVCSEETHKGEESCLPDDFISFS